MIGPGTPAAPEPRPRRMTARALTARADDALGEMLRSGAVHGIAAETLLAIL